jgi:hypothetical protein
MNIKVLRKGNVYVTKEFLCNMKERLYFNLYIYNQDSYSLRIVR